MHHGKYHNREISDPILSGFCDIADNFYYIFKKPMEISKPFVQLDFIFYRFAACVHRFPGKNVVFFIYCGAENY